MWVSIGLIDVEDKELRFTRQKVKSLPTSCRHRLICNILHCNMKNQLQWFALDSKQHVTKTWIALWDASPHPSSNILSNSVVLINTWFKQNHLT